jgi:hypothetical protein
MSWAVHVYNNKMDKLRHVRKYTVFFHSQEKTWRVDVGIEPHQQVDDGRSPYRRSPGDPSLTAPVMTTDRNQEKTLAQKGGKTLTSRI